MATRERLYLEAVAALLPRFRRKLVVAPGQDVDVSLIADPESPAAGGVPEGPGTPSPRSSESVEEGIDRRNRSRPPS